MLFEVGGIVGFLLIAFWIWALVDCISSDPAMVRNLPKFGWLVIVILLFDIGAVLWLLLGRPAQQALAAHRVRRASTATSRRRTRARGRHPAAPEVTDRRSAELDRAARGAGNAAAARPSEAADDVDRARPS